MSRLRRRSPNVLLICVDDLKPILGCYGDPAGPLAEHRPVGGAGVLFERAYCNQAVCAPSRNALLTGLRPQTLGIYDLGTNFRLSRPDAVTLPSVFGNKAGVPRDSGKIFHVGHGNHEDPISWSVPHWKSKVVAYALPESRAQQGPDARRSIVRQPIRQGLPRGAAYESADVPDNTYPDGCTGR